MNFVRASGTGRSLRAKRSIGIVAAVFGGLVILHFCVGTSQSRLNSELVAASRAAQADYARAVPGLRHLVLPSQLRKEGNCHTRERVAICATTRLTPHQTLPILERLIQGPESVGDVPNTASCPASLAPNCTLVVDGFVDGDRADTVAYWHEIVARGGSE